MCMWLSLGFSAFLKELSAARAYFKMETLVDRLSWPFQMLPPNPTGNPRSQGAQQTIPTQTRPHNCPSVTFTEADCKR